MEERLLLEDDEQGKLVPLLMEPLGARSSVRWCTNFYRQIFWDRKGGSGHVFRRAKGERAGTAQRLGNPAGSPSGDAYPRHILDSINTSTVELL